MRVKELIEELKTANPNDVIVMAKDPEGNGYSPLSDLSEAIYVPETTYSGSIYMRELNEEDIKLGYTENDLYDGDHGVKAIVFCPTN